jgi:hypothetical protein
LNQYTRAADINQRLAHALGGVLDDSALVLFRGRAGCITLELTGDILAKRVAKKGATKASATTENSDTPKETCFTIMPFGGWFDDYYTSVYKPAIEAAGLSPCRADDLYRPSAIVNDIWSYTKSAKLILADLSGKNPNVFYELGLAHALAKPAILIVESMEDVPFDLRALRVLEYNKNQPRWGDHLQTRITKAIQEVIAAPLDAVLPAFLTVKHDARPKAISEQDKAVLELKREMDLLRNEVSHLRMNRRSIEPDEARDRIKDYVARGVPPDMILRRMRDIGAPSSWVQKRIDEFTTQQILNLTDSPKESE